MKSSLESFFALSLPLIAVPEDEFLFFEPGLHLTSEVVENITGIHHFKRYIYDVKLVRQ